MRRVVQRAGRIDCDFPLKLPPLKRADAKMRADPFERIDEGRTDDCPRRSILKPRMSAVLHTLKDTSSAWNCHGLREVGPEVEAHHTFVSYVRNARREPGGRRSRGDARPMPHISPHTHLPSM